MGLLQIKWNHYIIIIIYIYTQVHLNQLECREQLSYILDSLHVK